MIDGCGDGAFVAVGIENLTYEIEVDPCTPQLLVGLSQSTEPTVGKFRTHHVWLRLPLFKEAQTGRWNRSAQIHQMPYRPPSRDQRPGGTRHGVSHYYHVVATPAKSVAHHIRIDIEVRRPVVTRQLRRDDLVSCLPQKRRQALPAPRAMPCPMDQREC